MDEQDKQDLKKERGRGANGAFSLCSLGSLWLIIYSTSQLKQSPVSLDHFLRFQSLCPKAAGGIDE